MHGRALVILWSGVISFYPIKALILSRINFLILIDFLNSGFDSFFSNTTRFALAANSSEKIIEPIQSRCAMLRYSRLSNAQVLAKLLDVCDKVPFIYLALIYRVVNIYFLPSKLYVSSKSRFLAKNQL